MKCEVVGCKEEIIGRSYLCKEHHLEWFVIVNELPKGVSNVREANKKFINKNIIESIETWK